MTDHKTIRFVTRDDHRMYVHPVTGDFIPGVTSVIGNLPKPFLKAWGQKLVAESAVAEHAAVGNLIAAGADEAAVEYLKKAPDRVTGKSIKDGKAAHQLFEELALGNTVRTDGENDDVRAMADHFKHYLDTLQPQFLYLEEGVWDPDHDYAGTFDAVARYSNPDVAVARWDLATGERLEDGELVGVAWQDNKTTRSGVHAEVGLQLAGYRFAEYMLRADGSTMRNKPGDHALVLHVRPEGWQLVPVRATRAELDTLYHLRGVTDYLRHGEKQVVANPVAGNLPARRGRK